MLVGPGAVPRQELGKLGDLQIWDAGKHIGKSGLRVDVVELAGIGQAQHDRCPFTAAIGAGEQQ
jgi:hypothetical protein